MRTTIEMGKSLWSRIHNHYKTVESFHESIIAWVYHYCQGLIQNSQYGNDHSMGLFFGNIQYFLKIY